MNDVNYLNFLDHFNFSIAEHEMIYDNQGEPIDYKYTYVNQTFCDSLGVTKEEVINKRLFEIFPNAETFWIDRYNEVVKTKKPIEFIDFTKQFDAYFSVYCFSSRDNHFVTSFKDVTNLMSEESNLSTNQELIRTFSESSKAAFFEFDLRNKKFNYNIQLETILGKNEITLESYLNDFIRQTHPDDVRKVLNMNKQMLRGDIDQLTIEMQFYNQEIKDYIWISFYAYVSDKIRYIPIKIKGIVRDISIEKQREQEFNESKELFTHTKKIAKLATFLYYYETELFEPSEELNELLGIKDLRHIDQFRSIVHPEDLPRFDKNTEEMLDNPDGKNQYRITKNGEIRYIRSSLYSLQNNKGKSTKISGILIDVSDSVEKDERIHFLATRDMLTQIYNRNYFEEYTSNLEHKRVGLVVCDIDGLKLINDAFSHLEGDKLLKNFAQFLLNTFEDDKVARLGGDEFAVVALNKTVDEMEKYETIINDHVKDMFMFGINIGVSVGYSIKEKNEEFFEAFMKAENLMYRRKLTERSSRKSNALSTIMQTLDEKTHETELHCRRVSKYAVGLLQKTGRKRTYEIEEMKLVAEVHDIGKIAISESILSKPDSLTDAEYEAIKYHSEAGYKIVSNIMNNDDIAIGVLYHDERWDGTGYPHNLVGEKIPLYARIISIADAYDTMIGGRRYQAKISQEEAKKELVRCSGTQFDPSLVTLFIEYLEN